MIIHFQEILQQMERYTVNVPNDDVADVDGGFRRRCLLGRRFA